MTLTVLNRFICRFPWWTIVVFVATTAVFAVRLPELDIDPDVDAMMPREHPEVIYKDWALEYFAIEEPAVLLVTNDGPEGVFTPATLSLVEHLSEVMMGLDAIDGDDLVSLSEIDNITGEGDTLDVAPFFEDVPTDAAGAGAVRDAVMANPMMVGTLVNRERTATMIIGEIHDGVDKVELYKDLRRIVAAAPVGSERVDIAGRPVVEGEIGVIATADLKVMFPLVIAVAAVILVLALRCLRGVVLPLLVVMSSVVWTLGFMAWFGYKFYALSNTMPIILIPIGIANGIHIIHHYISVLASDPEGSTRQIVSHTMNDMARPVVATSITTGVGVASLALSSLGSIQSFGIFTAFGVVSAMVFSLTFLPAVLCVLPKATGAAARIRRTQAREGGLVARRLGTLAPFVTGYPVLAIGVGVALLMFGIAGIPRLVVDGSLLQNFPEGNAVKVADARFVEYFGGSHPMEIVIDAGAVDEWKDPAKLRAIGEFQDWLEASGYTGETRSLVDYVKRMNEVMNPEDPDAYRVPDDRLLIAQYLLLYSMSGEPDDFDDVVDYDYRLANVRAQVRSDHSPVLSEMLDELHAYDEQHLDEMGLDLHVTGITRVMNTFLTLITEGQVFSLACAIPLVFLITTLMCWSPTVGLLTVIPVTVATVLNFGMLGWTGVSLGVTTSLMSSMGIGIGVDYAIHFVLRYQRTRSMGERAEEAMRTTLRTSGVAIFYNALVVIAGFLVLTQSTFLPTVSLGYLVSFNMLVCFVCTVTMMAGAIHLLQSAFTNPKTLPGTSTTDGNEMALPVISTTVGNETVLRPESGLDG